MIETASAASTLFLVETNLIHAGLKPGDRYMYE